jgi:indole-3-glycerol phosphate synthase
VGGFFGGGGILDALVAATRKRLARDVEREPLAALIARCERRGARVSAPETASDLGGRTAERDAGAESRPCDCPPFERALRAPGVSFICEVKRASPSKGLIAESFPYLEIAADYEAAGAACISVLTEPDYFMGHDRYLAEIAALVRIPTLRKDFTVDAYQIYQAAALGAGAVLLICAITPPPRLKEFIALAGRLGLSALVEAHDERELAAALDAGARIVGVNNRDLRTFEVDLGNSARLRRLAPKEVVFVAESGIRTRADVLRLKDFGVDAALVGETLMRSPDRRAALRGLVG